ncbi:MAG TPA: alpha/beta hydrolase [Solirubrobacterales bacterium]|nr:alpha/beta hydrolase [Solirubrobacterales bacterium]
MAEDHATIDGAPGAPTESWSDAAGPRVRLARRGRPREAGDLPIVVLHGWGAHIEAVESIVAPLAAETEMIAIDLPGFGESAEPPEPWSSREYAEFVAALLASEGIGRCHLIGHSRGGAIAICLAAGHPELIGRLLLCDSAGLRPKRGWKYKRRVAVAKLGRVIGLLGPPGRKLQDRMRSRVASTDYAEASPAMRETFRRVIAEDLAELLPEIKVPSLLVWGDIDEDTPLWMGERMAELLPDGALVVFEGAGHFAYADQPGRFAEVTRLFLCEQPRQATGGDPAR